MKNSINFYPHYTDSHEHWKFELLRAKYDWQGEGIFWALNNLIGKSEDTILDLNNKAKRASIAAKFKFNFDEFESYLQYLAVDCELIIYKDGLVTTHIVKNVMSEVLEKRRKERERIENWRQQKQNNASVTRNKDNVTCNVDPVTDREEKIREEKIRRDIVEDCQPFFKTYGQDMVNKFLNYWQEKDSNGKERWKKEKTWETSRRLATWKSNESKFGNNRVIQKSNGINGAIV